MPKKGQKHSPEAIEKMRKAQQNRSPETRAKMSKAKQNVSPETRAKLSKAARNRSPETRAKISEANRNRSPETRAKLSKAARNRSPEHRAKISEANRNRIISPETRAKLSKANKGKKLSPEHRAKLSKANKGKKRSPETRAKISKANRNRSPEWKAQKSKSISQAIIEGRRIPHTHYITGYYFSPKAGRVIHRSALELVWFEEFDMDDSIIRYFVEPLHIPYQQADGTTHRYNPDVLLQTAKGWTLAEIKPAGRTEEELNRRKFAAGKAFAKARGWKWKVLSI